MRYSSVAVLLALGAGTVGAVPAASVPLSVPQEIIHPGDQLNVQVYGDATLTQTVTVLPDGSIVYPLIGRVPIAGKTLDQATSTMRQRLSKFVRQPTVTIAIAALGQPDVLVLGDVKTPGKYQLRSDARITDAIAAAGGIAIVNGDLPEARLSDPQGDVTEVPLQKLLHDGDVSQDKPLAEGDVVYVPGPVTFDIVVTGAVDHPGDVQVAEGDRLSMAIAKAGNSAAAGADLNDIKVMRTLPNGQRTSQTVNLYQALEKGDMTADIPLAKGDVVYVPQAKKHGDALGSPLLYLLGRLIIP